MTQQQPLTESEAVQAAESFVVQNGYTDLAPSESDLAYEFMDLQRFTDRSELLKARHDTLERNAYGIVYPRQEVAERWIVVFRYKGRPSSAVGRAVTMNLDGSNIRMQHQDFFLKGVDKKLVK